MRKCDSPPTACLLALRMHFEVDFLPQRWVALQGDRLQFNHLSLKLLLLGVETNSHFHLVIFFF